MSQKESLTIVGFGASTMRGTRPGVEEHETFLSQLEADLAAAGIAARTINSGMPGNSTTDALTRFERDVLAHQPHFVLLDIGIGDSWIDECKTQPRVSLETSSNNYRYIIRELKSRGTHVVVITLQPMVAPAHVPTVNARMKPYIEAQRRIAREEGLPVADVYAKFAELAIEGVDLNTLYTDGQHPNPAGHRIIADLLMELETQHGVFSRYRPAAHEEIVQGEAIYEA